MLRANMHNMAVWLDLCVCVCVQGVTLCSVSGISDDHSEGPGEAGWLGSYLHHLRDQRYHW